MTRSGPPGTELELAEIDENEDIPVEAEGMAAAVLLAVALVLIALAPFATESQPAGKAWYLAPINWPLFSLGIAALAGASIVGRFFTAWRTADDRIAFRQRALWAFGGLGVALEYSLYFCVYLLGVDWFGFTIATLLFLQLVVWRSGLRGPKWVAAAFAVTVGIVIVFRLGIGLWFPLAPIFKLFPAWVGNTLGGIL
ncbi:hypothetical protein [Allomesorhizobium camelthorni]|uniref:Tripartite tricarboxylate transporter TctB family protein n=1 Tax=Allomesorhizobium camelthorni TaxID=475069 RepID=A0A6G4WJS2_9HYPH|nr:hypothetical protein [Mesorhizobium camelthorni]NGO55011.1 hypothetical protein [Mesorhizobium camelthorni]